MFHLPANSRVFTHALPFHPDRATIDFESRSAANIRNGAHLYAKHRSTRILCLAFLLPGQCPLTPSLWAPAMGGRPEVHDYPLDDKGRPYDLARLFEHIREDGLVEAHNVGFELQIWRHIAVKAAGGDENGATGMGAPTLKLTQLRCSAAKSAAMALPRSLEGAGEAMDLPLHVRKDLVGGKNMLRLSKARKPKRSEPKTDDVFGDEIFYYAPYVAEEFDKLYAYCKQDVTAEHYLSEVVPDLPEREYRVWLADLRANLRGVLVDMELVDAAIKMEAELKASMNETLAALTVTDESPDGIKGTERAKLLAWLDSRGTSLPDSTAPTLDHFMSLKAFEDLDSDVRTVVQIARNINKTSVSKFKRIKACADPDDNRVRELVMYHGAATGRWSGKGIQVQNFPRGVLDALVSPPKNKGKAVKAGTVKMAAAVKDVKTGDLKWCQTVYGDVLSLLSSVLRGCLIPAPGKVFYVADYAAIEARVVLWLAGAKKALEVFLRGDDIYCDMASGIYGYPCNKKDHPAERQFGKVAILGLGYGMGWLTFLLTLRSYGVKFTPKEALKIMGDKADKYTDWVQRQLWPEAPAPGADAETVRKYRNAESTARKNKRRLLDEREDPAAIIAELALCKFTVDAYRTRYPEVKQLWADQEAAACRAVSLWKREMAKREAVWEATRAKAKKMAEVGKTFYAVEPEWPEPIPVEAGYLTWVVEGKWLKCYLPSGRAICYADPDVKGQKTPWGETRLSLRFMGVQKTGQKKWGHMGTYGGSIVENADQATARDMMADALVRIDATTARDFAAEDKFMFELIASIHDEALAEGDDDGEDHTEEFEGLMETLEPCYAGCPVKAEGARLVRYQK